MLSLLEFYPAVVGSIDQQSESRDGEVLAGTVSYSKAITTAGVFVILEVINATLKLTKRITKKLQRIKKLF